MGNKSYKKVYFVGIKGVGMAALAVIAKQAGLDVHGSDVGEDFITSEMLSRNGIGIDIGFELESINKFLDSSTDEAIVIYSASHGGQENPQVLRARELGINTLTFGQALGKFQSGELLNRQDIKGISVAGSHGKTTTSAMIATILKYAGKDPSYLIGTGGVASLGDAGYYGTGEYFVAESDEYFSDLKYDRVPKFHYQYPFGAVITNIDFDHPDVFDDLESIYVAFEKFVSNIQSGGVLTISGDNPEYKRVVNFIQSGVSVVTFGTDSNNTYQAVDISNTLAGVKYEVLRDGSLLGTISVPVIGMHNAINSLSAVALLHSLGIQFDDIEQGLKKFTGTKRRLELIGTTIGGAIVIDDYAHHPAEIKATLTALRSTYPDKKIITIFQPHTFSRTEKLIHQFCSAYEDTDKLLLLPIFPSAREEKVDENEQRKLYDQIVSSTDAQFIESVDNMVEYCTQNYNSAEYVIVTMGAGDVYKISNKLVEK